MSERRFLIFTKRGPIEIHFKLSHYVSLALTIVVGVSSIIYYSIVGISSAIDVAQKDIITEASANLPAKISDNNLNKNSNEFPSVQLSVKNPISSKILVFLMILQVFSNIGIFMLLLNVLE